MEFRPECVILPCISINNDNNNYIMNDGFNNIEVPFYILYIIIILTGLCHCLGIINIDDID